MEYYMCPNCQIVFDKETQGSIIDNICPNLVCTNPYKVFKIDEIILPTIVLLNSKNIQTQCCCGGHIYPSINSMFEIYITFKNFNPTVINQNTILPGDFVYNISPENDSFKCSISLTIHRADWVLKTVEEKLQYIYDQNLKLYKFFKDVLK